jgi:6-phosphogluconolactonase
MSSATKNNLKIFQTDEALFKTTANFIIETANDAIEKRGQFVIALSGGNTPNQLYSLLATEEYQKQMPWKNTFIFWGDERVVGLDDKLNNAHVAMSLLLDKIEIPKTNIYPIPVNFSPEKAAEDYEQEIKDFFEYKSPCLDLILLGLGANGHTASLFPGTEVLHETKRLVKEVYVEEQKMFRVTMTVTLINLAHNILFLVTCKEKAEMLNIILNAPFQPEKYPAQLIKPVEGNLRWFADKDASLHS